MNKYFGFLVFLFPTIALAEVPNSFSAGTPARAAEINENFNHLDQSTLNNAAAIGAQAGTIADNVANISANGDVITTNTANITSNTNINNSQNTSISTNTSNISSNSSAISSNASAIQGNENNLASQAANIATNASAIETNGENISAMNVSVGANATAISSNATDISANSGNIDSNTQAITTNAATISDNGDSLASAEASINGLDNRVTDLENNQIVLDDVDDFRHSFTHEPTFPDLGARTTYNSNGTTSYTEVVRYPFAEYGTQEAYALIFPVTVAFCGESTCPDGSSDETYITSGTFQTQHAVADSGSYTTTFNGYPANIEITDYRTHGMSSNPFTGNFYYTIVDVVTAKVTVKINETKLNFTLSSSGRVDSTLVNHTDRDLSDNVDWNDFSHKDNLVTEVIETLNSTSIEKLIVEPEVPM